MCFHSTYLNGIFEIERHELTCISCNSFLAVASYVIFKVIQKLYWYLEIVFSWFCDQKPFIPPILPWRVGTRKQYCCSRWLCRAPYSQSAIKVNLIWNIYRCKYTNHIRAVHTSCYNSTRIVWGWHPRFGIIQKRKETLFCFG